MNEETKEEPKRRRMVLKDPETGKEQLIDVSCRPSTGECVLLPLKIEDVVFPKGIKSESRKPKRAKKEVKK